MTCQMYPRYTLAGLYDHAKLTLAGGGGVMFGLLHRVHIIDLT